MPNISYKIKMPRPVNCKFSKLYIDKSPKNFECNKFFCEMLDYNTINRYYNQ